MPEFVPLKCSGHLAALAVLRPDNKDRLLFPPAKNARSNWKMGFAYDSTSFPRQKYTTVLDKPKTFGPQPSGRDSFRASGHVGPLPRSGSRFAAKSDSPHRLPPFGVFSA